jgi:hypothetical protein
MSETTSQEERRAADVPGNRPTARSLLKSFFMPVFWLADAERVERHARRLADAVQPGLHFADNLLTWGRNNSMLEDDAFVRAWSDNAESDADKAIVWRRYVLACAAYHCAHLDGDFVECGAYTGVGVKTVVDYLGGVEFPKTFWLYDLFEHDPSMRHPRMPAHGPDLHARIVAKFRSYPQVKVCKGRIPDVFAGATPERIAYLHIDLNEAPAELAALDHLFERVVPGGFVILDDYEWAGAYRAQKLAEDPWFASRRYRVMPLPTGQGLVIKR